MDVTTRAIVRALSSVPRWVTSATAPKLVDLAPTDSNVTPSTARMSACSRAGLSQRLRALAKTACSGNASRISFASGAAKISNASKAAPMPETARTTTSNVFRCKAAGACASRPAATLASEICVRRLHFAPRTWCAFSRPRPPAFAAACAVQRRGQGERRMKVASNSRTAAADVSPWVTSAKAACAKTHSIAPKDACA